MEQSEQGKTVKRLPDDETTGVAAQPKEKTKGLRKPGKDKMFRGAETK